MSLLVLSIVETRCCEPNADISSKIADDRNVTVEDVVAG